MEVWGDGDRARPPRRIARMGRQRALVNGVRRRRSRQLVPRPRVVQFSLTEEEFEEVSAAATRAGLARGAFAAEVTLAAARGTQAAPGRHIALRCSNSWRQPGWCGGSGPT